MSYHTQPRVDNHITILQIHRGWGCKGLRISKYMLVVNLVLWISSSKNSIMSKIELCLGPLWKQNYTFTCEGTKCAPVSEAPQLEEPCGFFLGLCLALMGSTIFIHHWSSFRPQILSLGLQLTARRSIHPPGGIRSSLQASLFCYLTSPPVSSNRLASSWPIPSWPSKRMTKKTPLDSNEKKKRQLSS